MESTQTPTSRKEETKSRRIANDIVANVTRVNYFDGLPVNTFKEVLIECGFNGEALDGIYCGHEGRTTEQVGPNTWFHMSWYRMPSGRYEVVAYLS